MASRIKNLEQSDSCRLDSKKREVTNFPIQEQNQPNLRDIEFECPVCFTRHRGEKCVTLDDNVSISCSPPRNSRS